MSRQVIGRTTAGCESRKSPGDFALDSLIA
jgi:hypothetical protein